MMRQMLALLIVPLGLVAVTMGADEVDHLINVLKPSPLDYAAWAGKLLNAVGELKDNPGAQARLLEKAYELGIKQAKGYPTAIKAAQALLKTNPDGGAVWQHKLLVVYKLDWQAADRKRKKEAGRVYVEQMIAVADDLAASGSASEAIKLYTDASRVVGYYAPDCRAEVIWKLHDIKEQQDLQQRLEQLKRALAEDPENVTVREKLIGLHVVELDKPAEARKLLTAGVSEQLRTYVPLAAGEVEQSAKEACLELGDWYKSLAAEARLRGKENVLSRAKEYYERFVELEADAVQRAIGKTKLAQVEKELRQLGTSPLSRGKCLALELGKGVKMRLLRISAGKFIMGSPESERRRENDEGPQHEVRISKPFYVGVTEVTQQQYAAVMGKNPSGFQGTRRPVERVSWHDALEFCRRLSAKTRRKVRLPTEAEWEYACRADSETPFSFANDERQLARHAWCKNDSSGETHPVGEKKPNAWGLHDMHGNVWEWCADWHGQTYYRSSPGTDPQGPGRGSYRLIRGGSWDRFPQDCRSASRGGVAPGFRSSDVGFRVVVSGG
jgi:formylglycine-generating enzyme required for sulfatase activity